MPAGSSRSARRSSSITIRRNLFVARFIGSPKMNLIEAAVTGSDRETATVALPGGGSVRVPLRGKAVAARPVTLGVRPERLDVVAEGSGQLAGTVTLSEHLGGETMLYVDSAGGQVVVKADGLAPQTFGDRVSLGLTPETCHLFDAEGGRSSTAR